MKTKFNAQKILLILFLLFIGVNASKAVGINVSATGKISGRIFCAQSKLPAEFVSVTLFSAADSSMIAGTISNPDGSFSFSMLEAGEYFLEISEIGFEKKRIDDVRVQNENSRINLGEIQLEPDLNLRKKHH